MAECLRSRACFSHVARNALFGILHIRQRLAKRKFMASWIDDSEISHAVAQISVLIPCLSLAKALSHFVASAFASRAVNSLAGCVEAKSMPPAF